MSKCFFTIRGPSCTISVISDSGIFDTIEKNKSCGIIMLGNTFTVSSYAIFLCKILAINAFSVRSLCCAFCLSISKRSLCSRKVSLLVDIFRKISTSQPTPSNYARQTKYFIMVTRSCNSICFHIFCKFDTFNKTM